MYAEKIVLAVKCGGKVLREIDDGVALPFGREYSVLVKNLDSVRVEFSLSIDGKDACDNRRVVIGPNSSINIERFIHNGNLNFGNKFKFIERSPDIEAHRGIGAEDGIIRVEAWKERRRLLPPPRPRWELGGDMPTAFTPGGLRIRPRQHPASRGSGQSTRPGAALTAKSAPAPRAPSQGITVRGGQSDQRFVESAPLHVETQSIVLVLRLFGELDGVAVAAPIDVDTKVECSTCNKSCEVADQFCGRCGTAVAII